MMDLTKSDISIATLLDLMGVQEPQSIQLNHVIVGDDMADISMPQTLERLPSFTAQYGGFVDVEFYLDLSQSQVILLVIRQSAMTFEELEENGDVLPNLTINCRVLDAEERERLNALAQSYIAAGKMADKSRGEALLTQYVEKAMFCSRKYGGMTNA